MSDCKHMQRMKTGILTHCLDCGFYFTRFELETLERAEQAEERVRVLANALDDIHEHFRMEATLTEDEYEKITKNVRLVK